MRVRRVPLFRIGVLALCLSAPTLVHADDEPVTASPRVRTLDPTLAGALRDGLGRSQTLRRLVTDISRTDGIVFIEPGRCAAGQLPACLLHAIVSAGGRRYLRVRVEPAGGRHKVAALIAHELRHALEVLDVRSATTPRDVARIYWNPGKRENGVYETDEAVSAETAVRDELDTSRGRLRVILSDTKAEDPVAAVLVTLDAVDPTAPRADAVSMLAQAAKAVPPRLAGR